MRWVRVVMVMTALACSACSAASETTAMPAPSAVLITPESCQLTRSDDLGRVAALAIDGLESTTSEDSWSRACALVRVPDAPEKQHVVSVEIGWMGTLHEYASLPGANPIVGLADQAYEFDDGRRIALRSGELVAVVSHSGGTPSDTEDLARQVAEQLPE